MLAIAHSMALVPVPEERKNEITMTHNKTGGQEGSNKKREPETVRVTSFFVCIVYRKRSERRANKKDMMKHWTEKRNGEKMRTKREREQTLSFVHNGDEIGIKMAQQGIGLS
jgi:hypothetical protein